MADPRRGLQVVRTPVALHVSLALGQGGGRGGGYPVSLLGSIAFVRQSFLDAQHQQLEKQRYEKTKTGVARPVYDPSSTRSSPRCRARCRWPSRPTWRATSLRSLSMAKSFNLDPVITGAREADQVVADLKAQNARVSLQPGLPGPPAHAITGRGASPSASWKARAQASKTPGALEKGGILFAFSSGSIQQPRDFVRNAARAVKDWPVADAAVRALTINAARIAGAADRLGSLDKGKIANVIVTDGDLFEDRTRVVHVFVDGRKVEAEPPAPTGAGPRARGQLSLREPCPAPLSEILPTFV